MASALQARDNPIARPSAVAARRSAEVVDRRLQSRACIGRPVSNGLLPMLGFRGCRAASAAEGTRMLESLPVTRGDRRIVLLPLAILAVMVVLAVLIGAPAS